MQLIVAMTGASGVVYGKRLLEVLREKSVETHLVVSHAAEKVVKHELGDDRLAELASHVYDPEDFDAPMLSGSFQTDGMVVVPCSMKTLAGIAHGYSENLILRAADVALKQGVKLILVPRETPVNMIHLENMLRLARQGAIILPAMPAYYHNPRDVKGLVDYVVGKILDMLNIEHALYRRWQGSQRGYSKQV